MILNKQRLNKKLFILIIDEGSPGHLSQSLGVVSQINKEGIEVYTKTLKFHYTLKGFLRPLMRLAMNYLPSFSYEILLKLCGMMDDIDLPFTPDLIISSGGKSIFASYVLKHRYKCKNIFVGIPHPYSDKWFDLIISPIDKKFDISYIVTGVVPNEINPDTIREAGEKYWHKELSQKCWSLFIGGDSKSHCYSRDEWKILIDSIDFLSKKYNIKWLITTSRRTPHYVEDMLEVMLSKDNIIELVIYNKNPKKVLKPFLYASEHIFVTQDSLTMASEAYNSKRPITLLVPNILHIKKGSDFEKIISTFVSLPNVDRIDIRKFKEFSPKKLDSDTYIYPWGEKLKEYLISNVL